MKPDPWGLAQVRAAELALVRERDLHCLGELLEVDDGLGHELTPKEVEAFADMHEKLLEKYPTLTTDARAWVEDVCDRVGINKTPPAQRRPVPRGREVPLADVLKNLPKRPPGRKK